MAGELSPLRTSALKIFDDGGIPPFGQQINSNGSTEAKFTELTGGPFNDPVDLKVRWDSRQKFLEHNWANGGFMTACNEFVMWYCRQLALGDNLGRFDMEEHVKSTGHADSWIPSSAAADPQPGDILLHQGIHCDVAFGFDAARHLLRVAAGQGGKARGFDILMRVEGKAPYDFRKLKGWVDIEKYMGSARW